MLPSSNEDGSRREGGNRDGTGDDEWHRGDAPLLRPSRRTRLLYASPGSLLRSLAPASRRNRRPRLDRRAGRLLAGYDPRRQRSRRRTRPCRVVAGAGACGKADGSGIPAVYSPMAAWRRRQGGSHATPRSKRTSPHGYPAPAAAIGRPRAHDLPGHILKHRLRNRRMPICPRPPSRPACARPVRSHRPPRRRSAWSRHGARDNRARVPGISGRRTGPRAAGRSLSAS